MAENTIVTEVLEQTGCVLETECGNCGNGTATAYCNDCKEFICNACRAIHNKVKLLKTHCITSLSQDQENPTRSINCPIHPKNTITLFCETCNELICTECGTADHQNHKSATIQEVFSKNKSKIVTALKQEPQKLKTN